MSALSSARSVALSAIERNFLKKFEKAAAEESFLKLYWDMSDAQSRAIKAALMACGVKHEGWSTDRLASKNLKHSARTLEKSIPYIVVNEREVLHYITVEDKDYVQIDALFDYVRTQFPLMLSLYPDVNYLQIQGILRYHQTILRPAIQLHIETHYEKNVATRGSVFTMQQLKDQSQALTDIPKALKILEKDLRECGTIYITGNEPCAADYVLFHEILDLDLINYKLDPKHYPHILTWKKACAGLRGNKEVYNLYAT